MAGDFDVSLLRTVVTGGSRFKSRNSFFLNIQFVWMDVWGCKPEEC
jgi:hypothetical protein